MCDAGQYVIRGDDETAVEASHYRGDVRTSSAGFEGRSLISCAVRVRGRHRGLPVAIDRAVKLPSELATKGKNAGKEKDNGLDLAEEIIVTPREES